MMFLPAGFAEATGDSLVTAPAIYMAGNVWYVKSTTGVDAVSPAGRERLRPLATLSQAITNASDDDVIVLMDGHAETIASQVTINKRLYIVAGGTNSGLPTVTFTRNFNGIMFSCTSTGIQFRNIKFLASTLASASARINCGVGTKFYGCYVESGALDTGYGVEVDANGCLFENCTFVNSSTTTSPNAGLAVTATIEGLYVKDTVFDGGTTAYINGFSLLASVQMTDFIAEGVTLRNGADIVVDASATGIYSLGASGTGGGRVIW